MSSGSALSIRIDKFQAPNLGPGWTVNHIVLTMTDGAFYRYFSIWMELTAGSIYQENGVIIDGNNMFDEPFTVEPSSTLQDDTFMSSGDGVFGDPLANAGKR